MWQKLKEYLDPTEFETMSGEDQEALLATLLLTKFADGSITLEESENIDEHIEQMHWSSSTPLRVFVSQTIAKVRSIIHDREEIAKFLEGLARQVSDKRAAQRIYDACLELARVDNEFHEKEKALLQAIKTQFNLTDG